MRGRLAALAAAFILATLPASARPAPESFADLAERSLPAVVNVSTTQTVAADSQMQDLGEVFRQFLDREDGEAPAARQATSLGSGFIIDPAGYVVTNNHVIENAEAITVILHDNRELEARLVGRDAKTDLALLKVEAEAPLPALEWGDSDALRIGDWVLAIGNPFGLGGTVTAGIVSARQRDINAGPYDDFLQTDASINRGNSGGPMFDMGGRVVGINSAIFSPTGGSIGIGFAIPANLARPIVAQLREFGHARRGWLGVQIQAVTPDLAAGLHLPRAAGALVSGVTAGSPAAKAGIRQGDVILAFDGRAIGAMRSLPRLVAESQSGRRVAVEVWRQDRALTLAVVLDELAEETAAAKPAAAPRQAADGIDRGGEVAALGLKAAPLDDAMRDRFGLSEATRQGAVVVAVAEGGAAAEKGLQEGDIIVEVDQQAVATPEDISRLVRAATESGYRIVTLLIERRGDFQWVAVGIR